MLAAFKAFEDAEDDDVFVNKAAIRETLFRPSSSKQGDAGNRSSQRCQRPSSMTQVEEFLRALLLRYSSPQFQNRINLLKRLQAVRSGRPLNSAPNSYYHLPGRAALCFQVQKCILPKYGFTSCQEGVHDMIAHCAQFLDSPRVASLMDETNAKLGMTPVACERFRKLSANLLPKKDYFASQHAARGLQLREDIIASNQENRTC